VCPDARAQHDGDRPAASAAPRPQETVFDRNPQHPWNRLFHLLYSRTTRDGMVYDQESLEPLFVPESKFLTSGPSHEQALALLDEFLKARADERITHPVKRAVLQRDLWAVFATTVGEARQAIRVDERGQVFATDRLEDPGDAVPEQRARRRQLQKRLVQVMRRIALKPEEIEALPDNLAEAVKAGAFPQAFDPKLPSRAFLPPDLLAPDGSWVPVSNPARLENALVAAPQHVRFTKGRSVFIVLLRLPEGRRATEAFVRKTADGDLPQFPAGTQTALLRRMLLIDSSGQIRLSPLTESVQLRVFRQMDTGMPYELTLQRSALFAGRHGGLRAVGADETSFFDFQTRAGDAFEAPKLRPAAVVLRTCTNCHARNDGRGGIHSVQTSYARVVTETRPALVATDLGQEARRTIEWTQKSYTWGLLQGLWEAQAGE
jgi:hypothetical protein